MFHVPRRHACSLWLFAGVVLAAACVGLAITQREGKPTASNPGSSAAVGLSTASRQSQALAAAAVITPSGTVAPQVEGWACPGPVTPRWGGAGMGDPDLPLWGNGGYHVTNYDVRLDIDNSAGLLAGHAALSGWAERALDAFNLDFAGMEISRLTVNGAPARYCMDDTGELTVIPAAQLAAGQPFTLTVDYAGSTKLRQINGRDAGWRLRDGGFYAMNGTGGPSLLYPSNEYATEKATYRLQITVPKPYAAIAIGRLASTSEDARKSTYVWQMDTPNQGSRLTVDRYVISRDLGGPAGLPIHLDVTEGVDPRNVAVLEGAPAVVDHLVSLFGPFPYDRLGITWVPTWPDQGEASATRVWLKVGISQSELQERLVHEITHQWFGSSVYGLRTSDGPLFEGLATYTEVLWKEKQGKPVSIIIGVMYGFLPSRTAPPALATMKDFEPGGGVFYTRPALGLHALRLAVGDRKFYAILRTYYRRHRFSASELADFIAVAREIGGQRVDEIFDAWFYQEAVPDIPELGLSKGN